MRNFFFERIQEMIDKCNHIRIDMYPEMSKAGRLHFHGICMFSKDSDILPFYVRDLKILNAHSQGEIDTIQTMQHDVDSDVESIAPKCCRECYMAKQEFLMRPWCDKYQVEYLISNYDDVNNRMNIDSLKDKGNMFI